MTQLTDQNFSRLHATRNLLVPALAILLFTGCQREEITVYRVPKELPATASQAAPPNSAIAPNAPSGRPQIGWKTPAGWEEKPSDRARVVSFIIKGEGKEGAEVAVMPFAGMAGNDLQFVNLWRDQLKLAPVLESELSQYTETVNVGGTDAKLFDVYGKDTAVSAERPTERIIVAMLRSDSVTWFFKLAGDGSVVLREKPKFLEFLKFIDFRGPSPAAVAAAPSATAAGGDGKPQWEVPATWKETAPGQMLLARFTLSETPKTDVTVSSFPGDVGGLLANVNRWRNQVKLPPVDQAGLGQVVTSLDVSGAKAMLVDMTGGDKDGPKTRIIGAIVPKGGQTWFYKMMGDEQVAGREKDAFLKFVQTVKYSDAR